jgi:biotin synthase
MPELFEILDNKSFIKEDVFYLLSENDKNIRELIKNRFNFINSKIPVNYHNSEKVIEISNYCYANCTFCQSRNDNNKLNRFRLNREEIIEKALELYKSGCDSIFLHSGYDDFYNTDRIAYIIYSIKKKANINIILSLGLRELNEYKEWKIAGADSYFLNIVSKNSNLYSESNSYSTFEKRVEHITELKRIGYDVGSGSIIGLPNQNITDLATDIHFLSSLDIDYMSFCRYGSFKSNKFSISEDEILRRSVEVAQILSPDAYVCINDLLN